MKLFSEGLVKDLDSVGLFLFAPLFVPVLIVIVAVVDGGDPILEVLANPLMGSIFLFSVISAVIGVLVILKKPAARVPAYVFLVILLFGFPLFTAIGAYGLFLLYRADKAGAFDGSTQPLTSDST